MNVKLITKSNKKNEFCLASTKTHYIGELFFKTSQLSIRFAHILKIFLQYYPPAHYSSGNDVSKQQNMNRTTYDTLLWW